MNFRPKSDLASKVGERERGRERERERETVVITDRTAYWYQPIVNPDKFCDSIKLIMSM